MRIGTHLRNMRYKLKHRTGYNVRGKSNTYLRRQLLNIIICIIIVLIIVMIKSINTEPTEKAIKIVKDTINYTVDIKKDSATAYNFVKNLITDTKNAVSVFNGTEDSSEDGFIMPVTGKIYQPFGEERKSNEIVIFHAGVKILTSDSKVMTIGDGLVVEVRVDKLLGNTIVVIHDELSSVYGQLDEVLISEGQTVKKGDQIGRLNTDDKKEKILYLEVREMDIPINPLEIIQGSFNDSVLR